MTFSNLNKAMNAGGEGADIGIVDGWSADWLTMGNAQAAANTLTHGECEGTMQIFIRDWETGSAVDCAVRYPNAFAGITQGGSPYIKIQT